MFSRIKNKILFRSTYLVVSYRFLSLVLKRLLYLFPSLRMFLYSYNPARIPPFDHNILKAIYGSASSLEYLSDRALNGEIFLFGHHLVRISHLTNHIYNYPSEASFLSHNYPHYSSSYVQLYNSSDVKYCWEYGRLQWLIPVAFSHYISPSANKLSFILDSLRSFFNVSNCTQGIHWSCTMDVSFRSLSLLSIYSLISSSLSSDHKKFFQEILYQHFLFIICNIELSFVNGNHLNSNLAALVHLSSFFKDKFFSPALLRSLRRISISEFFKQFDETGYNYEGSFPYLILNVDLFFFIFYPYLLSSVYLPKHVFDRFVSIGQFLELITCSFSLSPPSIGDNDSASILIPKYNTITDYARSYNVVSLFLDLYSSSYAKYLVSSCSFSDIQTTYSSRSSLQIPNHFKLNLNKNGFAFLKSDKFSIFYFNTKPGLLGVGGHTHADYLSILLYIENHPIFVDPGTPTYSGDPLERDHYRSELFHNTPIRTIVNDDFSYHHSLWSIKSGVSLNPIDVLTSSTSIILSSSVCLGNSSVHRTVNVSPSSIVINDMTVNCMLLGALFYLHPSVYVQVKDGHTALVSYCNDTRPLLEIKVNSRDGFIVKHHYYFSPAYGQRLPACKIVIHYHKPLSHTEAPILINLI